MSTGREFEVAAARGRRWRGFRLSDWDGIRALSDCSPACRSMCYVNKRHGNCACRCNDVRRPVGAAGGTQATWPHRAYEYEGNRRPRSRGSLRRRSGFWRVSLKAPPIIVGNTDDEHVIAVVAALGAEVRPVIVDVARLERSRYVLADQALYFELDGDHFEATLARGTRGWIRRMTPPDWRPGSLRGSIDAAIRSSWLALATSIAADRTISWITPYRSLLTAENKLVQSRVAAHLDLPTPRTVVVSDAVDIPDELGDPIVVKPLGPAQYSSAGAGERVVWTQLLNRCDDRLKSLSGAPFLVQEYIPAIRHLRVVTVREQSWACALDARDLPVDWRRSTAAHDDFEVEHNVDICSAAIRLATEFELGYSSQDWIDTDDRVVFIDLNPAGQWLFLPDSVGRDVAMAIAQFLKGA